MIAPTREYIALQALHLHSTLTQLSISLSLCHSLLSFSRYHPPIRLLQSEDLTRVEAELTGTENVQNT